MLPKNFAERYLTKKWPSLPLIFLSSSLFLSLSLFQMQKWKG